MDSRLQAILSSLLTNASVLNSELDRLHKNEQFQADAKTFQLIEAIRSACVSSLLHLYAIEHSLHRARDP